MACVVGVTAAEEHLSSDILVLDQQVGVRCVEEFDQHGACNQHAISMIGMEEFDHHGA